MENKLLEKLIFLYSETKAIEILPKLLKIIETESKSIKYKERDFWTEKDVVFITYADSFYEKNISSLVTLKKFLDLFLKDVINNIHILPFFPYSSDRGFSVIDFNQVKKEFGDWKEIENIAKDYRLMADLVLNHVSTQNFWFQEFLKGNPKYKDYFFSFKKEEILEDKIKKVFRPRPTPLLTPFLTKEGERYLWTTYSVEGKTDQIDLNYQNPSVLLEMVKIFLHLLKKGVRIIRLDAVGFIWKELGTDCFHRPQVHTIVQLFRTILDLVCPSALLITETNVPHQMNIAYFGDGVGEAQMVYNFSLPPLVLHSFYTGRANYLTDWAKTLITPSEKTTFFNFLATHDGIGVLGARDILPERELQLIFNKVVEHEGQLAERFLPNGEKTIYELNITWWSALNKKGEPFEQALQKFMTTIAISLALAGMPALYYHSFFGTENDLDGFRKTGVKRDINRKNFNFNDLNLRLNNRESKEYKVFSAVRELIKKRISFSAFHPGAKQEVLSLDERVFSLLRSDEKKGEKILALHNVSPEKVTVSFANQNFNLQPYEFLWEKI